MDRFIGLDVHPSSCTFGVMGLSGKRLRSQVVETNGEALVNFVNTVPGTLHLCLEECTQRLLMRSLPYRLMSSSSSRPVKSSTAFVQACASQ